MKNKIISIVSIILLFPSLQAGERFTCPAMPCPSHSGKFKSPYEENVDILYESTDLKQLQAILDKNISVDAQRKHRFFVGKSINDSYETVTPLMETSMLGTSMEGHDSSKVKFLLEHKANPNAHSSPHKLTPLMFAVNYLFGVNRQINLDKSKEIIALLIQYDADPYQKDSNGHNAFWHAVKAGKPELVKFMKNLIKERREIREAARSAQQGRQVTGIVAEYLIGPVSPAEQKKKEEASELPKAPGGTKSTSNVEETELPEVE